ARLHQPVREALHRPQSAQPRALHHVGGEVRPGRHRQTHPQIEDDLPPVRCVEPQDQATSVISYSLSTPRTRTSTSSPSMRFTMAVPSEEAGVTTMIDTPSTSTSVPPAWGDRNTQRVSPASLSSRTSAPALSGSSGPNAGRGKK